MSQIVDLTHPLSPKTPRSSDHPEVTFATIRWFSRHGIHTRTVYASLHSGTHVDAPSLYEPEGPNIDDIPISRLMGPGTVLDCRRDAWGVISGDDLEKVGKDVREGDIVILCTGWGRFYGRDEETYQLKSPGLDRSGVDWLVSKKLNFVCADQPSAEHPFMRLPQWKSLRPDIFGDVTADPEQFPRSYAHKQLFAHDTLMADHIGGDLPSLIGKRMTIGIMCAKYAGVEGAPARVFAILD